MLEEMNMPAYDPEVPEWHATVLSERENATEDEFEDWETAKKELRDEIINGMAERHTNEDNDSRR